MLRMTSRAESGSMFSSWGGMSFFQWAALSAGVVILAASAIPAIAIHETDSLRKDSGWRARARDQGWVVTSVDGNGPAAGKLAASDRIVSINGDGRAAKIGPELYLWELPAGKNFEISVGRKDEIHSFSLAQRLIRDSDARYLSMAELLEAWAFLFVGMLIAALRWRDRRARLAVVNSCLTSIYVLALAANSESGVLSPLLRNLTLVLYMVAPFHWLGGYYFYSAFPFDRPESGRWRWLGRVLLGAGVLLWFPLTLSRVMLIFPMEIALTWADRFPSIAVFMDEGIHGAFSFYIIGCICSILAVVVRNYRSLPEGDMRRRIRWVAWGAVFGLLPVMSSNLTQSFLKASSISRQLEIGLFAMNRAADMMALIIPITVAYAVIKHRVLGVGVVVRIGLQYLLARNVLRAILLLPAVAMVYTVIAHRNETVTQLLSTDAAYTLVPLATGLALLRYRAPLAAYIDRRFFRESYQQQQILMDLMESVKKLSNIPEICQVLGIQIDRALHPRSFHIFLRQDETQHFSTVHALGAVTGLRMDSAAGLVGMLEARRASVTAEEWRRELPADELKSFDGLEAQLAVPVLGTDYRLLGLILLGEKRSEEPILQQDRKLLEAVSTQTGVVLENLVLRERQNREREMQAFIRARLGERQIDLLRECPRCGACYGTQDSACEFDGAELVTRMPIERVIQRKYRLDRVLGSGGMGTVYQAFDLRLGRKVAVKVMSRALFGNNAALRRFVREAHASARLHHPNIAGIYDFGEVEGGGAFLVLEYVAGSSLRREMHRYYGNPVMILDLASQALDAVEAAHAAGIVHRDLKPENILLVPSQLRLVVKVVDFGLAKVREPEFGESMSHASTGAIVGTLAYMAPEQYSGLEVDQRADIYALGLVTLELLGAHVQFRHLLPYLNVQDALNDFVARIEEPTVNRLGSALRRATALDRAARFASIQELRSALIPALEACPSLGHMSPEAGHQAETLVLGARSRTAGEGAL